MTTDSSFFRTQDLVVGYDGVPLINDIQVAVEKGEILTLIGPNGAGKSTILKTVTRQLAKIGGQVFIDGREVEHINRKELSRMLSVVLTERVRPEMMTCEDVVGTGRYPYTGSLGILNEDDYNIVQEAMEMVHISDLADRDFSAISDGQRQRVMLARAICQQPQLMILDEPTSYLDVRYKLEFLSILQKMSRERGLTVVMSLHELDLAERVSDKILCVHGTTIDRFGTPDEIFTPGYVNELYELTVGTYDESSGRVELPAVEGEPQVFVIAGAGTGTRIFRSLQRQAIPFAAGILPENDLDYPVARSLAAQVVSVPCFAQADENALEQAKGLVDSCEKVICTLDPDKLGLGYVELLLAYAEESGKPVEKACFAG